MNAIQTFLAEHIDIWTAADTAKRSGRGRASSNAGSVYGVKKLRELILELAVRGKLVPQDDNDEPASELLKRIQAEKTKLMAEGTIKKSKPLAPITDGEKPFEIPHGWVWARLDNFVLSILSGGTPSKNNSEFWNGDIPWASVKDLNVEKFLESTQDFITKDGLEAGSKLANKGDLLICTRMGLGKIAIAAMDVAINQDLKALKITTQLDINYFINFYSTLKIIGSGMTVAGIRQDELLGYCVPTPPLLEQHRIVSKVNELMALCDQLESQHTNATEAHEKLVSHLLGTLTQSQSAADFSANWQRIAARFDTLFTSETSIDALKQTLLQLAVMGKLVPQDPNDEPASELLKRIQAEKARLIAEGKIKKDKPLPLITDEEKPFVLPQAWEWVRFNDLINPAYLISYGVLVPGEDEKDGVPFVRISDLDIENPPEQPEKSISREIDSQYERTRLEGGEILMGVVGSIGKLGVAPLSWKGANIARAICRIKASDSLSKNYIVLLLQSRYMQNNFIGDTKTLAQPTLNIGLIRLSLTPLPPFEEENRIVAKVDELFALCDQLKTRITQANQLQQKLADVMVEQAVA